MKCQSLFSGKIRKNISKCQLQIILSRVLSINHMLDFFFFQLLYLQCVAFTRWLCGQLENTKITGRNLAITQKEEKALFLLFYKSSMDQSSSDQYMVLTHLFFVIQY